VQRKESHHAVINRGIIECRGATDILDMVDAQFMEFDMVNWVTALHRIAKAHDVHQMLQTNRIKMALQLVSHQLPEFQPQHLSNNAWAMSVMLCDHQPLWDSIAVASLPTISFFGARSL